MRGLVPVSMSGESRSAIPGRNSFQLDAANCRHGDSGFDEIKRFMSLLPGSVWV